MKKITFKQVISVIHPNNLEKGLSIFSSEQKYVLRDNIYLFAVSVAAAVLVELANLWQPSAHLTNAVTFVLGCAAVQLTWTVARFTYFFWQAIRYEFKQFSTPFWTGEERFGFMFCAGITGLFAGVWYYTAPKTPTAIMVITSFLILMTVMCIFIFSHRGIKRWRDGEKKGP